MSDTQRAQSTSKDIREILEERGSRYGEFDEHARITQNLKYWMADSPNWVSLSPAQREALEMVAHKVGRILNGDPNYLDSWQDIVGYTQLVVDIIEKREAEGAGALKEMRCKL